MSYAAIWPDPEPFIYHPFASLPKGGWCADELPTPPRGWRWLKIGEEISVGDLCCDPRSDPVEIVNGGSHLIAEHHPVLSKVVPKGGRRTRIAIPKSDVGYLTRSDMRELQDDLRRFQQKWHDRARERRRAIESAGLEILARTTAPAEPKEGR